LSARQPIRTIGHGTRTIDELVSILRAAQVELVIDVRRYPVGRRQPRFARDHLAVELPRRGIGYEAWSEELGGRRDPPPPEFRTKWRNQAFAGYALYMTQPAFRTALAEIERMAQTGQAIALMCSETLWWRCHRRLIADALVADGFEVCHLIKAAPGASHPRT
jgi:uncharacterized protein (DUF488 family)